MKTRLILVNVNDPAIGFSWTKRAANSDLPVGRRVPSLLSGIEFTVDRLHEYGWTWF